MIQIPNSESKTWQQANNSDLFGNIVSTRNITFDKKGYLRLSNASRVALSSTSDADLDEAAVFVRSADHGYWVETHNSAFEINKDTILGIAPAQDVTAGVPSGDLQSDATFASGLLIVTQDTDVDYYDPAANTWTDTNISLTATTGSQHPIEKFLSLGSVAIADVNTVKLYASPFTATPTLQVTLTILADFYITSLAYFNQNLYIGTINKYGGHAFLYVWNGYGTAAQSAYEVDAGAIWDLCVHEDSIVLLTSRGQLLRFNGSGFTQLDAFPTFYTEIVPADEVNVSMYHNCMKSVGDILLINFAGEDALQKITGQPDGIWCYDSNLGFMYHRYALSSAEVVRNTTANTAINTTTNAITVTASPITGTECLLLDSSYPAVPGGLRYDKTYYVIKIDATTIKLATTRTLALAGTPIDITSQPASGNGILVFFPRYDYGQTLCASRSVAILPIERNITKPEYGTEILYGGSISKSDLTSIDCIGTVSTAVENRGDFITPKINSNQITDIFNLITLKFSPFKTDTDKIIIKYRTEDDMRDFIKIETGRWRATWTSTTTFTTPEPELANAVVGDEVEFLEGGGAGILAHITAISENAGTYTVTIDEEYEYYTSGDLAQFVFHNWIKWKTVTYGDDNANQGFLSDQLGVQGKFLQIKVELRGVQTRIEGLTIDNKYHLPARV